MIHPTGALGQFCEALDQIRFDCNVHIVWKAKRNAFSIYAGEYLQDSPFEAEKQVAEAINRIYGVYCELSSRSLVRHGNKIILADFPRPESLTTHVRLLRQHEQVGKQLSYPLITGKGDPTVNVMVVLAGDRPPRAQIEEYKANYPTLKLANQEYLRALTQRALEHIYYFRGHCKMKVYIGSVVLNDHMRPRQDDTLTFKEFVDSTHGTKQGRSTKGELIRKYVTWCKPSIIFANRFFLALVTTGLHARLSMNAPGAATSSSLSATVTLVNPSRLFSRQVSTSDFIAPMTA